MQKYFRPEAQSRILPRVLRFGESLSHKIRLYLELLLDSLFTSDAHFSDKVQRELHELMDDSGQLRYLEYAFLAKKVLVKFQRNGDFGPVPAARLDNLEFFFKGVFRKDKKSNKIDVFVMYSLLRFATFIKARDGRTLIQRFRTFALVDQASFWHKILTHMTEHVYAHLDEVESAPEQDNSFMKTFTGLFKIAKKQPKPKQVSHAATRSFREIASLLFIIGLDFKLVVSILLKLSAKCGVKPALVKQIVVRNKSALHRQLLQANKHIRTMRDLRSLESRRRVKSYRSTLLHSKRRSLNESMQQASLESSLTHFERTAGQRLSKILSVVKLSLEYLVGKYGEGGQLVRVVGSFRKIKGSQEIPEPEPFKVEGIPSIPNV